MMMTSMRAPGMMTSVPAGDAGRRGGRTTTRTGLARRAAVVGTVRRERARTAGALPPDGGDADARQTDLRDMLEQAGDAMNLENAQGEEISEETMLYKKSVSRELTSYEEASEADLVGDLMDKVRDPEVALRGVAAIVAAGAFATLISEPAAAATGAGLGFVLIKALEAIGRNRETDATEFAEKLQKDINLNEMVKKIPMPSAVDREKFAKQAAESMKSTFEKARSIADSFDEVFGEEEQPKEIIKPIKPAAAAAPKPVAPPAPTPAPTPVAAKPESELAATTTASAPAAPMTTKKSIEDQEWENTLLKLQYSEQVIEDIRVADANAVGRAHARRLSLDFTPQVAKQMPATEYSFATATATASTNTSGIGAKPGQVVEALNTADAGYSSTSNRTRNALGMSPKSKLEQKEAISKDSWWSVFVSTFVNSLIFAALAAFIISVVRFVM